MRRGHMRRRRLCNHNISDHCFVYACSFTSIDYNFDQFDPSRTALLGDSKGQAFVEAFWLRDGH